MTAAEVNRQWVVARRPDGPPRSGDFRYEETAIPEPGEGEVLIRALYHSVAPVMRMYMMEGGAAGEAPLALGDVIHGRGVGVVVRSRRADIDEGDILHGQIGWRTHKVTALTPQERFFPMRTRDLPAHYALSALGMTGFSAWCGLVRCAQPRLGDRVLVSGAAGGVGGLVTQIARAKDAAQVVGIAGGPDKCAFVRSLGADAVIDYKNEPVGERIGELFPEGLDIYFDNVGGEILEAALDHLAFGARIVLCGSISEYTRQEPFGPRNYTRLKAVEAVMRGFFVYNHAEAFEEAEQDLAAMVRSGALTPHATIREGFECMPQALIGLYEGSNTGKMVVRTDAGASSGAKAGI